MFYNYNINKSYNKRLLKKKPTLLFFYSFYLFNTIVIVKCKIC